MKTTTEKIIDLIIEDEEGLEIDLELLREMGFEREVFMALFSCYRAMKIELNIARNSLDILEEIYYGK